MNHQEPITKHQISSNNQAPMNRILWLFGYWSLEFVWDLGFGYWNLAEKRSP